MKSQVKKNSGLIKYFVVSDIHSFYNELKSALWKAGFRKTNSNHYLIVCGDIFDRGPGTMEVYNFLRSIPRHRRIMIKGNHEYLYEELLHKSLPEPHDISNGTVRTFCHIAGYSDKDATRFISEITSSYYCCTEEQYGKILGDWNIVIDRVVASPVTNWLLSNEWKRHYYELSKYIFVHSFIPTKLKEKYKEYENSPWFYPNYPPEYCEYDSNWRESKNWFGAVWGNPWLQYKDGLCRPENDKGKTLVCGHWRSYDFRVNLDGVKYLNKEDIDYGIYYSKDIIALDACTVVSGQCNVLVIDDIS